GGFGQIGDLAFLAHHNARHDGLDVTIAGEPFLPKNLSHKFFDFFNKIGGNRSFAASAKLLAHIGICRHSQRQMCNRYCCDVHQWQQSAESGLCKVLRAAHRKH
ncbi:MAG: hypothetical protein ABJP66_01635, partial [Hyphomicrobiales bacterium]|uniref:hypothetical protein n=1 Tax=Shimia thalassica TaxID=1715693 RepID=UPI003298531C